MTYTPTSFQVGEILPANKLNQLVDNDRDHEHGVLGVLDHKNVVPQADATYTVGKSGFNFLDAFIYRKAVTWSRIAGSDFAVASADSNTISHIFTKVTTQNGLVRYRPTSRGHAFFEVTNAGDWAELQTVQMASPYEWSALAFEVDIRAPSAWSADINHFYGLIGDFNFVRDNFAVWSAVNSGFLRPRTRTGGGTITEGTDVAVAANARVVLGVVVSSGTGRFYLNNSLQQTVTTAVPSTYLYATIQANRPLNSGAVDELIFWMRYDVTS
jgi:hypothetical protein